MKTIVSHELLEFKDAGKLHWATPNGAEGAMRPCGPSSDV